MRVLFTPYPHSLAHLFPITPLAWALQAAGHEVRVAAQAGHEHQVTAAGLVPVTVGDPSVPAVRLTDDCVPPRTPEEVDAYTVALGLDERQREDWIVFYQYLMQPISDYVRTDRSEASDLLAFAEAWQPDLVLWDATHPVGAIAARVAGAAHGRLLVGQDYYAWCLQRLESHRDALVEAGLDENPYVTALRPLCERHGIEIADDLLYGQWTIDPMPEGMRLPTTGLDTVFMRHVPYAGAEAFPSWLHRRPERPRIAMSLGESVRRFINGDWDRTPKIMKALEGIDVEVVATLNKVQLADVERVPDNVRLIDWVSLPLLMPTCRALIHHGGIGTFSSASAHGVAHLVCDIEGESLMMRLVEDDPHISTTGTYRLGWEFGVREDETVNEPTTHWELPAKKVEATPVADFVISRGSGARLDHRAQSVEEMRHLIEQVATADSYRRNAAIVRDEWLATPSPAEIVTDLEKLVLEHRAR